MFQLGLRWAGGNEFFCGNIFFSDGIFFGEPRDVEFGIPDDVRSLILNEMKPGVSPYLLKKKHVGAIFRACLGYSLGRVICMLVCLGLSRLKLNQVSVK